MIKTDTTVFARELLAESDGMMRSDPERALALGEQALAIARVEQSDRLVAYALHNCGYASTLVARYDDALVALGESLEIYHRIGFETGILLVSERIAATCYTKGEYAQAIERYLALLERTSGVAEQNAHRGFVFNALGACYCQIGELDRAIDMVHAGLVLSADLDQPVLTMQLLQNAGTFHIYLDEYDKAERMLNEALRLAIDLEDAHIEAATVTNLATIDNHKQRWERAGEYNNRSLELYRQLGNRWGQVMVLGNMAQTARGTGQVQQARELFTESLALANPDDDRASIIEIYIGRGELNRSTGELQEALRDFNEALRLGRELGRKRQLMELESSVADVYERLGDAPRALGHFKEFSRLREELLGEERQKVTAEFQARFDAVHAEHQSEIYRLRAEKLEEDVRKREQELATMALALVHENEMMGTLRNRLARVRTHAPEQIRLEIDAILRDLDTSNQNAVHWQRFEQQLDLQQREFIALLVEMYPALRPMELKVAALLRLGLTSKDIALLLHTSVRNIESHRYWIRKALGLSKETNLGAFLGSLAPARA